MSRTLHTVAVALTALTASIVGGTALGAQTPGRDTLARISQSLTVTPIHRSVTVGDVQVTERVAPFSWRLTGPRFGFRLAGTPLQLTAPNHRLDAFTPTSLRVDYMMRPGDSVSVYGRLGSSPTSLDALEVSAVGAAGTSVVDLSSQLLGLPARAGVRAVFSLPVGDFVLGVSGAVEHEPTPSGNGAVYWQGTTGRGGLSLRALNNGHTYVVGADVAYSSADSLRGRNQFPGGGSASLSASMSGALDENATFWFSGDAFYARPFSNTRTDQPTRLIPSGDLAGLSALIIFDTRAVTWAPTVSLLRESSRASVSVQNGTVLTRTSLSGNAWSLSGSLSVEIPLGRVFSLSPEAGVVNGTVSSSIAQTNGVLIGRRGRTVNRTSVDGASSSVRGWWSGVGLSARF